MVYRTDIDSIVRIMVERPTVAHTVEVLSVHNYKSSSDIISRIGKKGENHDIRLPAKVSDALQELITAGVAERNFIEDFPRYRLTYQGREILNAYRKRINKPKEFSFGQI